jgi:hypothetical protein
MDAITMPSISSLAIKLQADFPAFIFAAGDTFRWSPEEKTILYVESSDDAASLLHELSHALLNHSEYLKDISLIEMERDAWNFAVESLAKKYNVSIEESTVQDSLDTYRDWLHARSTCPTCQATGVQTKKDSYKCLVCGTNWRVNEARLCALRRYKL